MKINFAILTVSDRSYRGERLDSSGPALIKAVQDQGWKVTVSGIVPDEFELIKDQLIKWCDSDQIDVILTTGGTGFAPRDITPEATLSIAHKIAPGFAEVMRSESLKKTPFAMLSRSVSVIRNRTLIINLPGSPGGAVENFSFVFSTIPHAIELLKEDPEAEAGHKRFI